MGKENKNAETLPPLAPKMSPDEALKIVERFGVEDGGEEFLVHTHFSDGKEVTYRILKRKELPIRQKGGGYISVPVEDIIEAVQTFYPTIEKGADLELNMEEAIKAVRARPAPNLLTDNKAKRGLSASPTDKA